ncbi:hypothetical protein OAP99_02610 [Flavobacteriaceae bacterium]|nr:hypothetical protein [Flavobacteriaceae bacterium]
MKTQIPPLKFLLKIHNWPQEPIGGEVFKTEAKAVIVSVVTVTVTVTDLMNKVGVVFRKNDIDSYQQMKNQAFKFIAAVSKKSKVEEVIYYGIHQDSLFDFHSHIVFDINCLSHLKKESERVLKASNWFKDYRVNSHFYSHIEVLKSAYGEVRIHACPEITGFLIYMREHEIYFPKKLYQRKKELAF